jgi:hypothetical protein
MHTPALLVARQDRADLRLRERLVDFHARAARIGEDHLDAGPFEGLDEDVAPQHHGADLLAGGAGSGGLFLGQCRVAHNSVNLLAGQRRSFGDKKPTAVASRGFLESRTYARQEPAPALPPTTRSTTDVVPNRIGQSKRKEPGGGQARIGGPLNQGLKATRQQSGLARLGNKCP